MVNPFYKSQVLDNPKYGHITENESEYNNAVKTIQSRGYVSISAIQRDLRLGYNHALRLVEHMENDGIVSKPDERGFRTLIIEK